MSYTRPGASGHYIYGDGENVNFNGFPVTDDEIDVFIHELYGDSEGGGAEFWERFYHGRRIIENFQKGIEVKRYYKYSDKIETAAKTAAALACEIWREHYTPIIGAEQVEYMLAKFQSSEQIYEDMAKNDYVYFIAECVRNAGHHVPIGYCAGQPKEEYLFLSKLYVRKDYRGRGIARSFIEESAALCRWKYGFSKIRLTVNKNNADAIAAYNKMGFETIDSVKTDIGGGFFMDDYVMDMIINRK